MEQYKTLLPLPGINVGTIFSYHDDDSKGVELIKGDTVGGLLDFIKGFGIDNDFFEKVGDLKTISNLKEGERI